MPSFFSKGILVYLYMCDIRWSSFVLAKAHFTFALNSYLMLKSEFMHYSSHHGRYLTWDLNPLGCIKIGLRNIWLHSRNISLRSTKKKKQLQKIERNIPGNNFSFLCFLYPPSTSILEMEGKETTKAKWRELKSHIVSLILRQF